MLRKSISIWNDLAGMQTMLAGFFLAAKIFGEGLLINSMPAARTNQFYSYVRIGQRWLSELRWLCLSVPWWAACELISLIGSHEKCLDSTASPLQLRWVKGVPPVLLAEWPRSFMCHCGNMGVEWTLNNSQHTQSTLEKKILPPLLLAFKPATFWSRNWHPANKQCILS